MTEEKAKGKKPRRNFEDSLVEIERIVEEIETGDLPLDEIVPKFRRATDLITECRSMLEVVQQQIQVIENEAKQKSKDK